MEKISLERLDRDIDQLRKLVADGTAPKAELDRLVELRKELVHATSEDWDAYAFLIEHLPPTDSDELLVILKGHLLIEFQVRNFVQRRMLNPDAINSLRISSYVMIAFAKGLCLPNDDPKWLWERVRDLNGLRNKLAHNLKPEGLRKQIDAFVTTINARERLTNLTLSAAIARLYGMLKGLNDLSEDPKFKLPK